MRRKLRQLISMFRDPGRNFRPFGFGQRFSPLNGCRITSQQRFQRNRVNFACAHDFRKTALRQRKLGRDATGGAKLEPDRRALNGDARGVGKVTRLSGGHGREGHSGEQHDRQKGRERGKPPARPGHSKGKSSLVAARLLRRQFLTQSYFRPQALPLAQAHRGEGARLLGRG